MTPQIAEEAHITVRTGTPVDIHPVMRLALAACEENGLTDPDPERLLQEIWPSLNLDGGIIGVIGDGPTLEAAILLRVDCMWYSSAKTLLERAIFVHPDHRKLKGRTSQAIEVRVCHESAAARRLIYAASLLAYSLLSERTAQSRLYASVWRSCWCVFYI